MTTIRLGRADDAPWMLEELHAFDAAFRRGKFSLIPSSEDVAKDAVLALLTNSAFVTFIAERDGERIGFIVGHLGPHFYNPEFIQLTELLWWVPPQERGSLAGGRLLDAYVKWGRVNADLIVMTLNEHTPIHQTTLERRGFTLTEHHYHLEVRD